MKDEPEIITVEVNTSQAVELDQLELICRMLEANGSKRPAGMTAQQAVDALEPDSKQYLQQMSRAALLYVVEQMQKPQRRDH